MTARGESPPPAGAPADPAASPSRLFIERPVATSLFMLAILLSGLIALRLLPLSALPEVDYPTIQVSTLYPGASPDVMAMTVTAPLERQFGQMAGLQRMSSVSSGGASIITLQFGLALSLDVAEQEVQAAINAAATLLPGDLPAPPVYAKVNPADAPIMTVAVTSATRTLSDVQNLVAQRLAAKLAQVSGVGLVSMSAGQRPAVRIQADMPALAAQGLTLENLRTAIAGANANGAKGSFDGPTRSWSIDANDQLGSVEQYRALVVGFRDGAAVHLSDVARVVDASENSRIGAWMNRQPGIIVDIQRQPGANVISTVDAVQRALPGLEQALPGDVHVTVLADRTTGIRASVRDVGFELVLAVALVVVAIFLFLGSPHATLIAAISVPLSLVGSFGAMYLMGFSLNNLTLMALTIASGFVVDDAIVVIEDISRHVEEGHSAMQAALRGAREVGFTIISLTVSLVAVLIPLLFMGDVVGRLFREFAVSLAVTILISAVVSLTLVPMLAARWLRPAPAARERSLARIPRDLLASMARRYATALDRVLLHRPLMMAVFALTLLATGLLVWLIPKGLFPEQDTGQLQATVIAGQDVSFARMASLQRQVADIVLGDPDVESLSSSIGVDGRNATLNQGRMLVNLRPKAVRRDPQDQTIARLLQAVRAQAGGIGFYLRPVQDLTIDAEAGPTQYRFAVQGAGRGEVDRFSQALARTLRDAPEVRNAVSDVQAQGKAIYISVDRDAAARVGVTAAAVDAALYDAFGQRIVSTIFTPSTQERVILEAFPDARAGPEMLQEVHLAGSGGAVVPLTAIATISTGSAALAVVRAGQFPASTIGFDLAPGVSLGRAVGAIAGVAAKMGLPAGLTLQFLGASSAFQASLANEGWLILAAIVCVYITLGVLYESYVHPLTILSTLPSAGLGALLALLIAGNDLGVIGIIGIVLLIGIVKKNAIMMNDFAIAAQRGSGLAAEAAIRDAAALRFRPIMMTTFAALFAAIPLILGGGMGSELRQPLGIAVAGGLVMSQALTLFTTPVIYLVFEDWTARLRRAGGRHRPAA